LTKTIDNVADQWNALRRDSLFPPYQRWFNRQVTMLNQQKKKEIC